VKLEHTLSPAERKPSPPRHEPRAHCRCRCLAPRVRTPWPRGRAGRARRTCRRRRRAVQAAQPILHRFAPPDGGDKNHQPATPALPTSQPPDGKTRSHVSSPLCTEGLDVRLPFPAAAGVKLGRRASRVGARPHDRPGLSHHSRHILPLRNSKSRLDPRSVCIRSVGHEAHSAADGYPPGRPAPR